MNETSWFLREEDWVLKQSIIFNKNLVRLTFLEIGRLLKLLGGLKEGQLVLDLCCGIGRHSLELARHGLDVVGVDITQSYLDIAEAKAEKAGLNIEFVRCDMKEYCQKGHFDLIVNLCTSFGYFDDIQDDLKVLENVYQSLKKGGRFVIEILGKEVIASRFAEVENLEFEGYQVLATSRILQDWSMLECKRLICKDGVENEVIAYHRLYSASELKSHLSRIGFKNLQVYGDFAGSPYNNHAKSLIIIAEK